jgi:signal transduction histidine kinase
VTLRGNPSRTVLRLRHPQTTVRWRFALIYAALFLVSGAALLAITYTLVEHATASARPRPLISLEGAKRTHAPPTQVGATTEQAATNGALPPQLRHELNTPSGRAVLTFAGSQQRISDLHQLEVESVTALAIMAMISGLLGWWVAGRVLAPLRMITATTQEISDANLHRRLALVGPRDELRQLADTIDGLLERLETAFDAQRRFVANASHELRTPLTTMRTTLDVAIAKPHVPPQLQSLDTKLRADLDQADQLVESFLVLARAQHAALDQHAPVSMTKLIDDALAAQAEQLAAKRLKLRSTLAPVQVTGSETLLARMTQNVIENAIRHSEPDGRIHVACEIAGDEGRLIVESDGPVLDGNQVARLAQPFRRLGAERTGSQNGQGLGLSIVAAVAAAHGGTLELKARPQGGLSVQITLPAVIVAPTESMTT